MITTLRNVTRLDWFNRASGAYLLLAVPLYWNFEAYDTTLWEKFLVAHIIVLRMAAGWLGMSWEGRENRGRYLLDLPILLYLGWAALSWTSAINPLKSGMEVIRILLAAAIYFSVSRTYRSEFRDVWLGAASLSLAAVSFIGIVQYLGFGFLDWRSAGLPSSTFFYRNYAAMFVVLVLPLAACAIALAQDETHRWLHAVASALGAIFLLYTRTRGAWLGAIFGIGTAVTVLWFTRDASAGWRIWTDVITKSHRVLWVCGLVVVCASLVPPSRKSELETIPLVKSSAVTAFASILTGESSGRTGTWLQSLQMIADHPIRGVGIGNWDAEYLQYAGPILSQEGGLFGRPHNDYLWALTELGLPGLILFVAILGVGLWLVWEMLLKGREREDLILLTALGAGLIAIAVHAFFSFPRERMSATAIPFLFLGWVGALGARQGEDGPGYRARLWQPALLLVLTAVTLWPTVQTTRSYRAYFWADAYRIFDRNEDALNAIQVAIECGVVDHRFYELKARLHNEMGDPASGLEASERALDYHPYNPWHYHKVGSFQMQLGNFDLARDAFQVGLRYGPGLGRIRRDFGQAYVGIGLVDSGRIAYEAALKVIPRDALLRTKLAQVVVGQGDYVSAQEHIAVAADKLKLTLAHLDIAVVGDVAMEARAFDTAIQAYGRAAALVPDNVEYQRKLAGAFERNDDPGGAATVLKRLLNLVDESERIGIQERVESLESRSGDG